MNRKDNSGPVFPHLLDNCQRMNETKMHPGLSKRELFAAIALSGVIKSNRNFDICNSHPAYAEHAVKFSDALLAELEKSQ